MKIEVLFLDQYGDIDNNITPVILNSNYDNRYILAQGNFITINEKDYRIKNVKGTYEESELVKIEVKVCKTYVGEF